MKKITKEEWKEFVGKNCIDTYSFIVCLAILEIWEASSQGKEQASIALHKRELGLSGAQADMAISFALDREPDGWLDEEMVVLGKDA